MAWASLPIQVRIFPSSRSAFERQLYIAQEGKRTNERIRDLRGWSLNASQLGARCILPLASQVHRFDTSSTRSHVQASCAPHSISFATRSPRQENDRLDSIRHQNHVPSNHLPVLCQDPWRVCRIEVVDDLGADARINPQLARLRSQSS